MSFKADLKKVEKLAEQEDKWLNDARDPGSHECVAAVKALTNAPHTVAWRRGKKVRGNNIEPGTAIATFPITVDKKVKEIKNGKAVWIIKKEFRFKGHSAIFAGYLQNGTGIEIYDQYPHPSKSFGKREIKFSTPGISNNADAFYVIELLEAQ